MNENYFADGGFISIFLKESEPVSIFRTLFTEEILTSNYHKADKVVSISRLLQNGQRTTIA